MPEEIKNKETDTHFEGDSVVGVAKGRHNTLITLVNTASQFLLIKRSENKTGQATVNVFDKQRKKYQNYIKLQKHYYQIMEQNLVRRYFKKGKLVEELSDEDILNIAKKINNMPRKALGYKTPLEVFENNLKKKGIDTSFLDIYRIKLPKCLEA